MLQCNSYKPIAFYIFAVHCTCFILSKHINMFFFFSSHHFSSARLFYATAMRCDQPRHSWPRCHTKSGKPFPQPMPNHSDCQITHRISLDQRRPRENCQSSNYRQKCCQNFGLTVDFTEVYALQTTRLASNGSHAFTFSFFLPSWTCSKLHWSPHIKLAMQDGTTFATKTKCSQWSLPIPVIGILI